MTVPIKIETEAGFTDAVVELAQTFGFLVHHDRPARTNQGWRTAIQGDPGFPDIVAVGYGRLIVAELKVGRNVPSSAQQAWLWRWGALAELCPTVEVHLWRPEDWPEIAETFKRRGGARYE